MRHNEVIYLGEKTVELDDNLNQIETFDYSNKVYANEHSITSTEFYAGAASGLKPEKSFEIYGFEYDGQERFKFNGQEYDIIQTRGKGEKIVIIGEKIKL
jgi:SPP1 family predicted phage head-tail adaptor